MKWLITIALLSSSLWAQLASTLPTLPTGITTPDGYQTLVGTAMDTSFPSTTSTVNLHGGGGSALQTALTALIPGELLLVDPGVYQSAVNGGFTLPCIANAGNLWTVIMSSGAIPAEHNRIDPSYLAQMVQMVGKAGAVNSLSQSLFIQDLNSGHGCAGKFRFVGVDFFVASGSPCQYTNGTSGCPSTINNCFSFVNVQVSNSSNVVFDRVRCHGNDDLTESSSSNPGNRQDILHCWAIGDNSEPTEPGNDHIAIIDSYCDQVHAAVSIGADTQCVLFSASPGPFKMVNNYLSSTGEGTMTSGTGDIANTRKPADIEFRGNHVAPDQAWRTNFFTVSSTAIWGMKNGFECKTGNRTLAEGNVIENEWASGNFNEHGNGIRITPRVTQGGNGDTCNNMTIANNVILNANIGMILAGFDDTATGFPGATTFGQTDKLLVQNNVIRTMDQSLVGANNLGAWCFQMGYNVTNANLNHNTCFTTGTQGVSGQNSDAFFRWPLAGTDQSNAVDIQPFMLLNAAGSGYSANDLLTLASPCSSLTQMTVLTVDGSGHILTYTPANGGFGGSFGCTNGTTGVTGGTGTGATFTITMTSDTNKWLWENIAPDEPNSDTNACRGGTSTPGLNGTCLATPTSGGIDFGSRFPGNFMWICPGYLTAHAYPPTTTTSTNAGLFAFVNSGTYNYQLTTPYLTAGPNAPGTPGNDGVASGIYFSVLCPATAKTIAGTVAGTVSCGGTVSGQNGFQGVTMTGVAIQ